jgi:hypothetical protein
MILWRAGQFLCHSLNNSSPPVIEDLHDAGQGVLTCVPEGSSSTSQSTQKLCPGPCKQATGPRIIAPCDPAMGAERRPRGRDRHPACRLSGMAGSRDPPDHRDVCCVRAVGLERDTMVVHGAPCEQIIHVTQARGAADCDGNPWPYGSTTCRSRQRGAQSRCDGGT